MRMFKSTLSVLLVIFIICAGCLVGYCAEVKLSTDSLRITISGKVESGVQSSVCITIPQCGMNYETYASLNGAEKAFATKDVRQIQTDENGNYSVTFGFSGDSGVYTAVVSDIDGVQTYSFEYPAKNNDEIVLNNIDQYTSTQYTPWFTQYHFTTEAQLQAGQKGGEGGQMGFAMAYSTIDSDIVYFGTDTSGIWKSTDSGATWKNCSVGLKSTGTIAIICDKYDVNKVYAAISPNFGTDTDRVSEYTGLYTSYDGGITWNFEQRTNYYRAHTPELFAYLGNDLYVASHSGEIYKRVENAWELVYTYSDFDDSGMATKTPLIYNLELSDNLLVFGSAANGVYSSSNGITWQQISNDLAGLTIIDTAIDPVNGYRYCATTDCIYKSTNNGLNWSSFKTAGSFQSSSSIGQIFFGPIRTDGTARMYVNLAQTAYPLRYSDDGGATFNRMAISQRGFMQNKTGYYCEPICVNPSNPDEVIASVDAEIFKSVDGGANFVSSSSGFSGVRVKDMDFNPNDNRDIIFSFTDFGNARSYDSGQGERYPLAQYIAGERYNSLESNAVERNPFNSDHILIQKGSSNLSRIVESKDNGQTWNSIDATIGYDTRFIYFNRDVEGIIYATSVMSNDGGINWYSSEYPIYAVSPLNGNIVYGVNAADNKLMKSSDCGATWMELCSNVRISEIQTITADLRVLDKLYIGFYSGGMGILENGVLKRVSESTDGYSMKYIYHVAQNPLNPEHLIAGGVNNVDLQPTEGLFQSYDHGNTWFKVKGLPFGRDIWRVFFHPRLNKAYISTSSGTYVYEYDKYVDYDLFVDDWTIYNTTEDFCSAVAISAVYDSPDRGRLLRIHSIVEHTINPMGSSVVDTYIPHEDGEYTRIFVWSDLSTIKPIHMTSDMY